MFILNRNFLDSHTKGWLGYSGCSVHDDDDDEINYACMLVFTLIGK